MAIYKDSKGGEWEIRLTVPKFLKICRKLKLKIQQITSMDIEVADLVEALPIVLEEQLREKGISGPKFLSEMEPSEMMGAFQAMMEAVGEAFPQTKQDGGEAAGPFDLGEETTS
jgi:hypothetical protein